MQIMTTDALKYGSNLYLLRNTNNKFSNCHTVILITVIVQKHFDRKLLIIIMVDLIE